MEVNGRLMVIVVGSREVGLRVKGLRSGGIWSGHGCVPVLGVEFGLEGECLFLNWIQGEEFLVRTLYLSLTTPLVMAARLTRQLWSSMPFRGVVRRYFFARRCNTGTPQGTGKEVQCREELRYGYCVAYKRN